MDHRAVACGSVTFESEIGGTQTCRAPGNTCAYTNESAAEATLTITAIPDDGHTFTGWSGDIKGNENPLALVADRDYFFNATFNLKSLVTNVLWVNFQHPACRGVFL